MAESGQPVRLLVRDAANEARAASLVSAAVTLERRVYGDVWLRDTGPLVVCGPDGQRKARRFGFNGWGGKYLMDGDQTIGAELAQDAGLAVTTADWILEGGALDGDGTGLVVTTEQCLLNPNRNPQLGRAELEARLARDLGYSRVLWLGEGLINDHTDGHVDNLARFVAPGVLALPRPTGPDDPNAAIYADARARAEACGRRACAQVRAQASRWVQTCLVCARCRSRRIGLNENAGPPEGRPGASGFRIVRRPVSGQAPLALTG